MAEKTGGKQKGAPKTGGRKKGTPNKRTQSVAEMIESKGVNPIEAMADCLKEAIDEGDNNKVMVYAEKLAPYFAPRLASTKVDATVDVVSYEDKLDALDAD